MKRQLSFISMGSNLGEREFFFHFALKALSSLGRIDLLSPCYETEPVGVSKQPFYLNAVLALDSHLDPTDLLEKLLNIEQFAGRTRKKRWEARTLDLDLLFVGDICVTHSTPIKLELPHPRLHLRRFVLQPFVDIAPHFLHPRLATTMIDLLHSCPDKSVVLPYQPETILWEPIYP